MTTNTKAILLSFFYTLFLPFVIAAGLSISFAHILLVPTFFSLVAFSVLFEVYIRKFQNAKTISDFAEKYSNLKYKRYLTPLTCQACAAKNVIEIDLDKNTEFKCTTCGKQNAVYVQFITAIASKHEKI